MQGKNVPAIALLGVAALFIIIGINTASWAGRSTGRYKASLGTSEMKFCRGGDCQTRKFDPDRMRRSEDKLAYMGGKAVYAWGIINFLLLVAGAVLLGLGHGSSHIPPRISLFTCIVSLLLGAVFVLILMAVIKGKPMATPGYSFYLHNLGCILGIVGGVMAWKKAGGGAEAGMAGPMGQPMPGQPMPGQPMPGQPMQGQPMPGQPMPGQPMDPAMQAQQPAMDPAAQAQQPAMDPGMLAPQPGMDPAAQAVQPPADPAAQAQPANCQTCGAPARWVPEYSRHYCDACQQYV